MLFLDYSNNWLIIAALIKIQNNQKMLRIIAFSVLSFFLIAESKAFAQSRETMKVLMGNEWIGRYKKLKYDLENKVARAKDMENLSEKNIADIRDNYVRTSLMLENWLMRVVESVELNSQYQIQYLSKGDLSPELQESFRGIVTSYANDFTSDYEEITGIRENLVLKLPNHEVSQPGNDTALEWKIQRDDLMACIMPLLPNDWNSIN